MQRFKSCILGISLIALFLAPFAWSDEQGSGRQLWTDSGDSNPNQQPFSEITVTSGLADDGDGTATLTLSTLSTPVSVANGGTGAATLTGILQGNGTSAITGITNSSTAGQVLRVTGASTYAWGALDLADTDAITGTLAVSNGGTGITSLGAGVATWLGTPSASNLRSAVTGTTGTAGNLVFSGSPTLTTPDIGSATASDITISGTSPSQSFVRTGATTYGFHAEANDLFTFKKTGQDIWRVQSNGFMNVVTKLVTEAGAFFGGAINASAASSLIIPTTGTPSSVGQISFAQKVYGTPLTRGVVQSWNGSENTYLVGTSASDAPANGEVPKFNTNGTITWESDSTGSSGTLDQAYDSGGAGAGRSITADTGAVAITVPDASNNAALTLNQNNITNDPIGLSVVNTGDGNAIDITAGDAGRGIQVTNSATGNQEMINLTMQGSGATGIYMETSGAGDNNRAIQVNGQGVSSNTLIQMTVDDDVMTTGKVIKVIDNDSGEVLFSLGDSADLSLGSTSGGTPSAQPSITFNPNNGTAIELSVDRNAFYVRRSGTDLIRAEPSRVFINSGITIGNDGGSSSVDLLNNNSGDLHINAKGGDVILNGATNLGIGTTNVKFHTDDVRYLTLDGGSTFSRFGIGGPGGSAGNFVGIFGFYNNQLPDSATKLISLISGQTYASDPDSGKLDLWSANDGSLIRAVTIDKTGNVGIGVTSPTNLLSLEGNSARTIWMERHSTSNTAGNSLTVQSGGATSAATNKSGGALTLKTGVGTGNSTPATVNIQAPALGTGSGTSDQTLVNRILLSGTKTLTDAAAIPLINIAATAGAMSSGILVYSVEATDGTDHISDSGSVYFAVVNKAGTFTTNASILGTDAQAASGVGHSLVIGFSFTNGSNAVTLDITSTAAVIVPTTYRCTFSLISGSQQNITVA